MTLLFEQNTKKKKGEGYLDQCLILQKDLFTSIHKVESY